MARERVTYFHSRPPFSGGHLGLTLGVQLSHDPLAPLDRPLSCRSTASTGNTKGDLTRLRTSEHDYLTRNASGHKVLYPGLNSRMAA